MPPSIHLDSFRNMSPEDYKQGHTVRPSSLPSYPSSRPASQKAHPIVRIPLAPLSVSQKVAFSTQSDLSGIIPPSPLTLFTHE
jgi:hypothetical protein